MRKLSMITLVALALAGAQAQERKDIPQGVARPTNYWEWTGWKWSVDDSRVAADRQKVNDFIKARDAKQLLQLAVKRRKEFETAKKPDALTLTSWVLAARNVSALDPAASKSSGFSKALWYLDRVTPVASYEYARARFIASMDRDPDRYLELGDRLLQRNPQDYVVKYAFVQTLIVQDNAKARRLCTQLVAENSDKPGVLALMASCYYVPALSSNNRDDLLKAKDYYQQYVQKAGSSDAFVAVAKMRLDRIEKKIKGA